jgi:hypothetical protein
MQVANSYLVENNHFSPYQRIGQTSPFSNSIVRHFLILFDAPRNLLKIILIQVLTL